MRYSRVWSSSGIWVGTFAPMMSQPLLEVRRRRSASMNGSDIDTSSKRGVRIEGTAGIGPSWYRQSSGASAAAPCFREATPNYPVAARLWARYSRRSSLVTMPTGRPPRTATTARRRP